MRMRDSNGSKKKNSDNKDSRHRALKDEFTNQVGLLISTILGARDFEKRNWKKKIELVKEAKEKLNCPESVLKWCGQLMENKSSSSDINKAGSEDKAYENPESSHDNILGNQKGARQLIDEALQGLKEQTQLHGKELEQIANTLEQMHQIVRKKRDLLAGNGVYFSVFDEFIKNTLEQMNQPDPQDVTVLAGNSGDEWDCMSLLDPGMMDLVQDVTDACPAGNSGDGSDLKSLLDPGMMDLVQDVTVQSNKQSYKVHPDHAELLKEIFEGHPEIDQNFQIAHPDFQSNFMDSLVEIYRKIKECKLEMKDIESMYLKVQDMEKNGLQLTWLKEGFEKARKKLERGKKRRKIEERKKKYEEEHAERMKKYEEEMAELDEEDS